MGAQHIRDGAISVKQEIDLVIPLHPTLAAIIAATPGSHLTFLTTRAGRPFEASSFSRWFRNECDRADFDLRECWELANRRA